MDNVAFALVPTVAIAFLAFKPKGLSWKDYLTMNTPLEPPKPPRPLTYQVTLGWLRRSDIADLPDDTPLVVKNSRNGILMPATYALVEGKPNAVVLETF